MKLLSIRVTNYKNIIDSNEFTVNPLTSLVGKNESGKTALLQSLAKLNPAGGLDGKYNEDEFPRMGVEDDANYQEQNVITTRWELEASDLKLLEPVFGQRAITTSIIKISKGYDNEQYWSVDVSVPEIIAFLAGEAGLSSDEFKTYKDLTNLSALTKMLSENPEKSPAEAQFLANIQVKFSEDQQQTAVDILSPLLPKFLYFPSYDLMKGEVALSELVAKKENALTISDRIFLAFLKMADTSIEELKALTRFESLITKLERVSNRLSRDIFEYWSQNKHLSVDFRFDPALPGDIAPFNEGYIFRTRIKNSRHNVTVKFDERSTGFVWFFSFLVWFSQMKNTYGSKLIILLDEPGLNLHAKAQSDLLRYFKDKLVPNFQLIYSTHSPFMIDPSNLMSVRTVEDVVKDDKVLGSKVSEEVLTTDRDTLFPLQAALGYDVAQTLFVGKNILLVEGPSDVLYLQWASDILKKRKRTSLDSRWTITPAGSIDKISSFVTLFSTKNLNIAALTDFAKGDKNRMQKLKENQVLKSGRILTFEQYVDQEEADIEDIFGRGLYIELITACYNLKGKNKMPEKKSDAAPIRVVKEVEQHFAALPPDFESFDHFHPAAFLIQNTTALLETHPDFEGMISRFEEIFKNLNPLAE